MPPEFENLTPVEIELHKLRIDGMSHYEMAELWRFAPSGHPYFDKRLPIWEYFKARFDSLGGWTPEISKAVGLNNR